MNKIRLLALGLFLSATIHGQTATKQENIRKLIDISAKGQVGDTIAAIITNAYKKQYPQADSAFWKSLEPELKLDKLFDMLIPIYDKYYTDDDVKQLLAVYQTPIGKKMIALLPQIMKESMSCSQQWAMQLNKTIQDKLKEAGY